MIDILAARHQVRGRVDITPLRQSEWLTSVIGCPVLLKLECVQRTGSFKIRGAINALARLQRGAHIVTASAGNHGRAIAAAADRLGMQATVFAPRDAPQAKLNAIARLDATLHLAESYDEAERRARAFAREKRLPFVSA
jgi:threonine dehydratase